MLFTNTVMTEKFYNLNRLNRIHWKGSMHVERDEHKVICGGVEPFCTMYDVIHARAFNFKRGGLGD